MMSETTFTLDSGEQLHVKNTNDDQPGQMVVEVASSFFEDVTFGKDIYVSGNVYLDADSEGVIRLGDDAGDHIQFNADVSSSIIPDVTDGSNTSTYSLGSDESMWFEIYTNNAYITRLDAEVVDVSSRLTVNGSILFDVSSDNFTIRGTGDTIIENRTLMTGVLSATDGPWHFVGDDVEQDPAQASYDSDGGVSYVMPEPNPPAFNVGTRSMFEQSLTALGPVQIGDLPTGVLEELDAPTLNIYGTTVVRDGNLKIQSDIRHLDDDSTLIRFTNDRIVLNVGDESAFELKQRDDMQHAVIGNENVDSMLNIHSNVGVFGENEILDVLGRGIDLHGSMRVTHTLSANNLVVDTITVLDSSSGNIGGGLGGGIFSPMGGVSKPDDQQTHVAVSYTHLTLPTIVLV